MSAHAHKETTMTKYLFPALVIAGLIFAVSVEAKPTGSACTSAGCFNANGDQNVSTSAATDSLEAELCLTTAAAYVPTSSYYLADAKSLYVENRSSATCYIRFDAGAVTTTGSSGYKFAAGTERAFDIDGTIFGPDMRVACTAAQTTGACLFLGWWK